MTNVKEQTTAVAAVANAPRVANEDSLARVDSFDAAMLLLAESGVATESVEDYGNGFSVCTDKRVLVGQAFVVLEWRFNSGDFGESFVSANIVTEDGRKLILNDGGTGIRAQLVEVTQKRNSSGHAHPQAGLLCRRGLSQSDYKYESKPGVWAEATTFYLAK